MDVPAPPLWQSLLLEQPWPLAVVLLLAAIVVTLAYTVETGREAVERRTLELVRTASPVDASALAGLLARDVVIAGPTGDVVIEGEAVHEQIVTAHDRYGVADHRVRDLDAWASGQQGRVMLALYSTVSSTPALTRWGLFWEKREGEPWRIVEVRWLSYQGQEPNMGWVR